MTIELFPGVRRRIYLSGAQIENKPSVFRPSKQTAKSSQRLASSALFTSYAALWDGCPSVITKRIWMLSFDAPTPADLLTLGILENSPCRYDLCPWLPEFEPFELPTSGATPTAIRRNGPSVVPSDLIPDGVWTAWFVGRTTGTVYAVSWGTADTVAPFRQTFTVTGMTVEEPGTLVYFPVYWVEPNQEASLPEYGLADQEKHTVVLTEC